MLTLKDSIGNEIKITSKVMVMHLKRTGIVCGTTVDGAINVRLARKADQQQSEVIVEPGDVMVCESSYTIVINEEQRLALFDLINKADADQRDAPLEFWKSMLTDLPNGEMEHPGIIHGFCL